MLRTRSIICRATWLACKTIGWALKIVALAGALVFMACDVAACKLDMAMLKIKGLGDA